MFSLLFLQIIINAQNLEVKCENPMAFAPKFDNQKKRSPTRVNKFVATFTNAANQGGTTTRSPFICGSALGQSKNPMK